MQVTHKWWCASLPSWNRVGSIPTTCSIILTYSVTVSTTDFDSVSLSSNLNRSSKWKIPKEWLAVLKTVKGVKARGGSSPSSSAFDVFAELDRLYMVFIVLMVKHVSL